MPVTRRMLSLRATELLQRIGARPNGVLQVTVVDTPWSEGSVTELRERELITDDGGSNGVATLTLTDKGRDELALMGR